MLHIDWQCCHSVIPMIAISILVRRSDLHPRRLFNTDVTTLIHNYYICDILKYQTVLKLLFIFSCNTDDLDDLPDLSSLFRKDNPDPMPSTTGAPGGMGHSPVCVFDNTNGGLSTLDSSVQPPSTSPLLGPPQYHCRSTSPQLPRLANE